MKVSRIKCPDIANGLGCRLSVFVSGCDLHCPGCFNEEAWDFDVGDSLDESLLASVIERLSPVYMAGLTVLGGEPLHPRNAAGNLRLCRTVKDAYPDKDIWLYTGYTFEQLLERSEDEESIMSILADGVLDVIVDGPYVDELHDVTLAFRGSRNQRILDAKASVAAKRAVEYQL